MASERHPWTCPHIPDQLFEHAHPVPPPDNLRMHHEGVQPPLFVGDVELASPDLKHLRRGGKPGVVRVETEQEMRRVIQFPAPGEFDEPRLTPVDGEEIWPVI